MGGAGLVFDNLGVNMVSLIGKAPVPSILYLNRNHGEEIEVEILPTLSIKSTRKQSPRNSRPPAANPVPPSARR